MQVWTTVSGISGSLRQFSVGLLSHDVDFFIQIGEVRLISSYIHIRVLFCVKVLSDLGCRLAAVT